MVVVKEKVSIKNKIMQGEKTGIGKKLDANMHNKDIAPYFRKKFGMSFHSAAALLYAGELVGHERCTSGDISIICNEASQVPIPRGFFTSSIIVKIKKSYGINKFPRFHHRGGAKKIKKTERSICMECYQKFDIDEKKYPANLCVCRECRPNGLGFSKLPTFPNNY